MIYDTDWDFLQKHFGLLSARPLGPGVVVRSVVHEWVIRTNAKMIAAQEAASAKANPALAEAEAEL